MPYPPPEATIRQGVLRGAVEEDAAAFLGIPYAASPTGHLRFHPPVEHPGWDGVRDASTTGPSVPQGQSRLRNVMGPSPKDSNERGCLNLNVWTPLAAMTDRRQRPVLLWIHGGGWTSGAGGWSWYDGSRLAANGDVVVVTINYRLGALGWLWLPEIDAGNIGAQDQGAALRWVRDNIASFGGDPGAITVGGQSAGAYSAVCLALDPATRPLLEKVVAQSGPWAVAPQDPGAASQVADQYLRLLGVARDDGLLTALQGVPVADLIAAYSALPPAPGSTSAVAPPMYPVLGGAGVPRSWSEGVDRGGLSGLRLQIGDTENEMTAFMADVAAPEDADDATRTEFGDGVVQIAEACAAGGCPAHVYRFARASSSTPNLGATHCSDLPFMFDNLGAYASAPMTGSADRADHQLAREISSKIANFVTSGFANGEGWVPFEPSTGRVVQRFDRRA